MKHEFKLTIESKENDKFDITLDVQDIPEEELIEKTIELYKICIRSLQTSIVCLENKGN